MTVAFAPIIIDPGLVFCTNDSISLDVLVSSGPLQMAIAGHEFTTNRSLPNPGPGRFLFIAEDGNACRDSLPIEVFTHPRIQNLEVTAPATCNAAVGAISIDATGNGTLTFEVNGNLLGNINEVPNLPPGNYQIVVEDENGCADQGAISIAPQPSPNIDGFTSMPTSCGEANGSLFVDATGGTGSNLYSIDGGLTFSTEAFFDNLFAGQYPLIVRDDAGCADSLTITIAPGTIPPAIDTIILLGNDCSAQRVDIVVEASGGTGMLSFRLKNRSTQSEVMLSNVEPGNYQVFVSDEAGCIDSTILSIPANQNIVMEELVVQDATCSGIGGLISFNLEASDKVNLTMNDTMVNPLNTLFDGLLPGAYHFRAVDERGCSAELTAIINLEDCASQVPNIFSPNGDGINDNFQITLANQQNGQVRYYRIFDRWGNLVYESLNFPLNSTDRWWNGKINQQTATSGVYLYDALIQLENGLEIPLQGDIAVTH